jgi:hypothetical protein
MAIDTHHFNLLNKLMLLVSKLPKRLLQKIVKGIREDKLSDEFYGNLKGLSSDE